MFLLQARTRDLSTGKNVQKWTRYSSLFFRRVLATSMTQRRVENTRVHFGANSPVSVKWTFCPTHNKHIFMSQKSVLI